jgi:21S rRNA (GM2251-2'-O)-methyltransferase
MNLLRNANLIMMMMLAGISVRSKSRMVTALQSVRLVRSSTSHSSVSRIRRFAAAAADSESSGGTELDEKGRRIRRRSTTTPAAAAVAADVPEDSGWENFGPTAVVVNAQQQRRPRRYGSAGWVDDDEGWDDAAVPARKPPPRRDNSNTNGPRRPPPRNKDRSSRDNNNNNNNRPRNNRPSGGPFRRGDNSQRDSDRGTQKEENDRKINMRALELAGFDHLYGLASVVNALQSGTRDFTRPEDRIQLTDLEGTDALEHELKQRARKPEAQFSPWLFVQDQLRSSTSRSADKAATAAKVLELAKLRGIPVAPVDKGVLNTLSNNRPHQGYVLRCGKLFLEDAVLTTLPRSTEEDAYKSFWLVLDEVVDPQNFGALLRSAYFLGGNNNHTMGILICSKNSAPPSPVVSAASAGALELMAAGTIHSTNNLPRTLATAEQDGFRIVGASSSIPKDLDAPLYNLQDLPAVVDNDNSSRPTVLVLGSEGHGLRPLVAKSCTEFVRIPSGQCVRDGRNIVVALSPAPTTTLMIVV